MEIYSIAEKIRKPNAITNCKLMLLVFLVEPEGVLDVDDEDVVSLGLTPLVVLVEPESVLGADDEDVLGLEILFPNGKGGPVSRHDVFVPLKTTKSEE